MRKLMPTLLSILMSGLLFLGMSAGTLARAQSYLTVTGSSVQDASGALLAHGQICAVPTDQQDSPMPIRVYNAGNAIPRSFCANITNGVIASGFQVANPATDYPENHYYRVTISDLDAGTSTVYKLVAIIGTPFDWDNYLPGATSLLPLVPEVGPQGNTGPTGPAGSAGATGPAGPAGAPYTGVSSDGANGLIATGNVSAKTVLASVNNSVNILSYGAVCDEYLYSGGSMTAGSNVLTGSGFASTLVGKTVIVYGAGALAPNNSYEPLVSITGTAPMTSTLPGLIFTFPTVTAFTDANHITLSMNAITTVSSAYYEIGTLNTSAIQAAYNAAASLTESLLIPASGTGTSCLTGTIDLSAGNTIYAPLTILGQGQGVSSITGLPGEDILAWPDGRRVSAPPLSP